MYCSVLFAKFKSIVKSQHRHAGIKINNYYVSLNKYHLLIVWVYIHATHLQYNCVLTSIGFSVLHLAIVKHRNECAKLLITELGVKAVSSLNESGVTAAHIAASAGT